MRTEAEPILPGHTGGPDATPQPAPAGGSEPQPPPPDSALRRDHGDEGFPPPHQRAPLSLLIVVTAISLAADLGTKAWAVWRLAGPDLKTRGSKHLTVIKDHLDFIFAQNPGGAWSFLRSLPDTLRRPFFLVVSAAAVVFIISIYRRIDKDQWAMKWGLPLALGGAIGNLVDRIRYGWVVDFIDFYVVKGGREMHWPTFNVADIAIVIGVGLMAIDMLWLSRKRERLLEKAALAPVQPPA